MRIPFLSRLLEIKEKQLKIEKEKIKLLKEMSYKLNQIKNLKIEEKRIRFL